MTPRNAALLAVAGILCWFLIVFLVWLVLHIFGIAQLPHPTHEPESSISWRLVELLSNSRSKPS
jgi:hypothetical protein